MLSIKKLFFLIIGLSVLWTGDVDARRSQRHKDSEKADAKYRKAVARKQRADRKVAEARKNRRATRKASRSSSSSRRAARQRAVAPVQRNFEVTDIGNGTSKINTVVQRDVYHGRRKIGTVPHVQASRIVPTSTTQQALSEEMAKASKTPPPPPIRLSKSQTSQNRSPFIGKRKSRR
ncbi:MAG: hypothetical protein JSR85_00810 [Proteobacteria bacterium]|nr:hypothetical protein [Pseudomonadota bacterium]